MKSVPLTPSIPVEGFRGSMHWSLVCVGGANSFF